MKSVWHSTTQYLLYSFYTETREEGERIRQKLSELKPKLEWLPILEIQLADFDSFFRENTVFGERNNET